jgi:hypothetical protein
VGELNKTLGIYVNVKNVCTVLWQSFQVLKAKGEIKKKRNRKEKVEETW